MEFEQIQELIKLISETGLSEVKIEQGDFKLSARSKDYYKNTGERQIVSMPAMQSIQAPPVQQAPPAAPTPAATPKAAAPAETNDGGNYLEVRSPIVGTFYRSASPEKPPYVKVGDTISVGDVVCIVEAMKLFNEIESEVSGKVVKVMLDDASPVEYDQVLYLVEPS